MTSQNAEKIIVESFSLEPLDNMQSDDQILEVQKAFLDLSAAELQKSEHVKVWYALDRVLSDLNDVSKRDSATEGPSSISRIASPYPI